jgi:nitrogen-specific signal transduction histidine kinase
MQQLADLKVLKTKY